MLLTLILPIFALVTACHCETTENEATEVQPSVETDVESSNSSMPVILDATASKLVRYRSKPPASYYRYKTQTFKRPRPRIKAPKVKYGPPMYRISEPSSYYKQQPETYTSTQSYKPSYSYDEIHYEVSSEFPGIETIPLSSYETQAMDLEFYGGSYSKKKTPQLEYSKPQKTYTIQRPHKVYGLPKESAHNSYDTYSGDDYKTQYVPKPEVQYEVSYHEEAPKQSYGPPPQQKEEYEQFPPYGAPPKGIEVSYQMPGNKYEAPVSSYHPQEQTSKGGPYPVYDKKLPNAGYAYNNHFAEPPTDVHITYSPSYEINPLPPKGRPPKTSYEAPPSGSYGPPSDSYGPPSDNYGPPSDNYGPPSDSYGPPDYNQKTQGDYQPPSDSYQQPSGGHFAEPPGSYLPPVHQIDDLPLKKNHMPPGYDYPKSSYEVPLYDPIPFESTTPEQDYFPPNHNTRAPQHEHVSESNNHIQNIPSQSHPSSSATTTTTTTVSQAQEPVHEATSKVHRFTPQNHRSNHVNRQETTSKFPVVTEETHSSEEPSSKYLDKILSTTSTFRPRRKRKRTKAPLTEKHILDAPELEKAFDSGHDQPEEPAAHASNVKENVDQGRQTIRNTSPVQQLTNFSPSQSWNPMRVRTKHSNSQRGQRIAESAINELKNIEVLSIEKSHSHSYYAGTVPPRTRGVNLRGDARKMGTVPSTTFKAEDALQPTRSIVIDKTYFKVKDDEEDFYDGTGELPKNHKLF